jgi:hypothetical protein
MAAAFDAAVALVRSGAPITPQGERDVKPLLIDLTRVSWGGG